MVDRSAMIARMKEALRLDPRSTAVITVDIQRGNVDPEVATLPVPEGECRRILENTARLLRFARSIPIPVVHVVTAYARPELASHPFERAMLEAKESFTPHRESHFERHKLIGSYEAQMMPELGPEPTDHIVDSKRTFDMFHGTNLELLLRALGADTLVLAGCNTNTCVLSSTFGAYNRGFRVVAISDCIASAYGEDLHRFALENIGRRLGWVLTLEELEEKLGAGRKAPEAAPAGAAR